MGHRYSDIDEFIAYKLAEPPNSANIIKRFKVVREESGER